MSRQPSYPYASGDLLEHRNTYFYSAYEGRAFLDAWRQQRADALHEMPDTLPAATTAESAVSPLRPTDILLETIYLDLNATSSPLKPIPLLDRLVQRFEVSKRLHGEYDEDWRPVDSTDYRSLERYVRFAEILDLAHQHTKGLTYLNALLKIVDTLTALHAILSTPQRTRLRRVIAHERSHVERLTASLTGKINVG